MLLSSGDAAVERSCTFSRRFSTSAGRTAAKAMTSPSVRRQMVPLIKLVHPDLFGLYPPDVANTNQKSLKVCIIYGVVAVARLPFVSGSLQLVVVRIYI